MLSRMTKARRARRNSEAKEKALICRDFLNSLQQEKDGWFLWG